MDRIREQLGNIQKKGIFGFDKAQLARGQPDMAKNESASSSGKSNASLSDSWINYGDSLNVNNGGKQSLLQKPVAEEDGVDKPSSQKEGFNSELDLFNEKIGDDQSQKKSFEGSPRLSEQVVNGMNVTLLNLNEGERSSVLNKMQQLRPTFNLLDSLMKTILNHGGDNEVDKIRKLSSMVYF